MTEVKVIYSVGLAALVPAAIRALQFSLKGADRA